ncbi:MAG TPA: CDP-glucose 4,6-dehydratase [Pseudolabrys sp.]|nr:CDP-glucose 4,6-dehydratase [Pseudolabrys sp.]
MLDKDFWASQRVLLTGHTGFKGSWLALWLESLGSQVVGFALPPDQTPNLYSQIEPVARLQSVIGDLRDLKAVEQAVERARPTIVIHMAAQALVRRSYRAPLDTWATNLTGSLNLLEALRSSPDLAAVLVVTTDKVYLHSDRPKIFDEDDHLGGHDPYSASKAALEIAVASYAQSFFDERRIPVATARAGNVLGGGDWSEDRLAPDVWRAVKSGEPIALRYPNATRPWQHVLDPLCGYLLFVERLVSDAARVPRTLNFGPDEQTSQLTVKEVVETLASAIGGSRSWVAAAGPQPKEMEHLALAIGRARDALNWRPRLTTPRALAWTAEWYRRFDHGERARTLVVEQIARYQTLR